MELNRASLVIGTPPSTPRNSLMLTGSTTQMFDLQEFLSKVDPSSDRRSKRGTIHEVEENDPDHLFMQEQAAQYKASQQSVSKSSTSLHSAHSASSIGRGGGNSEKGVIANPAALAGNSNFNNSNSTSSAGEYLDLQEMLLGSVETTSQSDGRGSVGVVSAPVGVVSALVAKARSVPASPQQSSMLCGSVGVVPAAVGKAGSVPASPQQSSMLDRHSAVSTGGGAESKTRLSSLGTAQRHGQRANATSLYSHKSEVLSKRTFHKSSGNVREGEGRKQKASKIHRSSTDLSSVEEKRSSLENHVGPLGLDLSDLADLTRSSEVVDAKRSVSPPRMSREDLRPPEPPQPSFDPPHPEETLEHKPEIELPPSNPASQHSSQDSGELLSWEDFLVSTSPTHQGPQAAPPTLSEGSGDDSIWLEYGSV